jgi:hypothetical protein
LSANRPRRFEAAETAGGGVLRSMGVTLRREAPLQPVQDAAVHLLRPSQRTRTFLEAP